MMSPPHIAEKSSRLRQTELVDRLQKRGLALAELRELIDLREGDARVSNKLASLPGPNGERLRVWANWEGGQGDYPNRAARARR